MSPGVCWNSCPLSRWCHPTISSSVTPFSCPQSFPASGSFPMSQLFGSGGQSIGVSAWASVLPAHIQGWFPLQLTTELNMVKFCYQMSLHRFMLLPVLGKHGHLSWKEFQKKKKKEREKGERRRSGRGKKWYIWSSTVWIWFIIWCYKLRLLILFEDLRISYSK